MQIRNISAIFSSFGCLCRGTNIEIPLSRDSLGRYWFISTLDKEGVASDLPTRITFSSKTVLELLNQFDATPSELGDRNGWSVRWSDLLHFPLPRNTKLNVARYHPLMQLTLRPDDFLIQNFRSVGIVESFIEDSSTTSLVVGMSDSYWNSHCVSGSELQFRIVPSDDPLSDLMVSTGGVLFQLGGELPTTSAQTSGNDNVRISSGPGNVLATAVPERIVDAIDDILVRNSGAIRSSNDPSNRVYSYRECTREAVSRLPDLTITWPLVGQMIIPSDQYIDLNSATNECTIKLEKRSSSEDTITSINILNFRGVNFRITPGMISFCDPL